MFFCILIFEKYCECFNYLKDIFKVLWAVVWRLYCREENAEGEEAGAIF